MKKFLLTLVILLLGCCGYCETVQFESNVTMDNFWQKTGKDYQKVLLVSRKLMHDNSLKRASVFLLKKPNVVNAYSKRQSKEIYITTGFLPYINNDDELAAVLAHELAHTQEAYDGTIKLMAMSFNSKKYEYKADMKAVEYMVKSGYNPIAAITIGNKVFSEPLWDWGVSYTHPRGSKRLVEIYKYIYKKYPAYLNSDMVKSVIYQDFLQQNKKELDAFYQKQAKKSKFL